MRFGLVALCLSFALGCGQKGNLYLRDNPPHGSHPAKTEPYQPVPYPSGPSDEGETSKK